MGSHHGRPAFAQRLNGPAGEENTVFPGRSAVTGAVETHPRSSTRSRISETQRRPPGHRLHRFWWAAWGSNPEPVVSTGRPHCGRASRTSSTPWPRSKPTSASSPLVTGPAATRQLRTHLPDGVTAAPGTEFTLRIQTAITPKPPPNRPKPGTTRPPPKRRPTTNLRPPFADPGEAGRQAAQDTLNRARAQLTEAGDSISGMLDTEADVAPQSPAGSTTSATSSPTSAPTPRTASPHSATPCSTTPSTPPPLSAEWR